MDKIEIVLTIFWILMMSILSYKRIGHGFSIIKVFNLVWLASYLVYLLNPYEYYELNGLVHLYTCIFVCIVNVSFVFTIRNKAIHYSIDFKNIEFEFDLIKTQVRILGLLSFVSWIFSYNRIRHSLSIVMTTGMHSLRTYVYNGDVFSTIERLIYQYFVQPMFIVTILIALQILIFYRFKRYRYILLVAFVDAFMYSLLFGGRALLVLIVMYAMFMLLINNGGKIMRIIMTQGKSVLLIGVIALIVLAYSMMRVSRSWGAISEYGVYITGGIPYLSYLIDSGKLHTGALLGKGIIGGIYDFFGLALSVIGHPIPLVSQVYSSYVNDFVKVSESVTTNFTATAMTAFLLDAGVIGLILGSMVCGWIFAKAENSFQNKFSVFSLSVFVYITNSAFETIQNYTYKSVVFVMVIMILWLLFGKGRIGSKRIVIGHQNNNGGYHDCNQ